MALCLPEDFDDYASDVRAKGCFSEAWITADGARYRIDFYDPVRLRQDVELTFKDGHSLFFEPNLVVIQEVTRAEMEKAANLLLHPAHLARLVATA